MVRKKVQRAGFIIYHKNSNSVLIVKERSGKFGFPKGHMIKEDGNILSCAMRELNEETSFDLSLIYEKGLKLYRKKEFSLFKVDIDTDITKIILKPQEGEILECIWMNISYIKENGHTEKFNQTIRIFKNHL